jgi:hypothetical protein
MATADWAETTLRSILAKALRKRPKADQRWRAASDGDLGADYVRFISAQFFREWYRQCGRAYFILFKKSLTVTNIQFAELLALLREHTYSEARPHARRPNIHLSSPAEIRDTLEHLIETFSGGKLEDLHPAAVAIAKAYGSMFSHTVAVAPLYNSCAVYLPPRLALRLEKLCGEAGYVHSCGLLVYHRKVYKALYQDLADDLHLHFRRERMTQSKIKTITKRRFIFYSHEDFDNFEHRADVALRDGIDTVKLHMDKSFMGSDSLLTVSSKLAADFPNTLAVPLSPKDPVKWGPPLWGGTEEGSASSFFLLADRAIVPTTLAPDAARFYICYEQLWKNENPLHLFDENKPAWVSHTTIPHTLMGAMINITRPWKPGAEIGVMDPFVGSGTTWLEVLKFGKVHTTHCSDKEPIVRLLAKDNLQLLFGNVANLVATGRWLMHKPRVADGKGIFYKRAMRMFETLKRSRMVWGVGLVKELKRADPMVRLLFYLALRVHARHGAMLAQGNNKEGESIARWDKAFDQEAKVLGDTFEELAVLRNGKLVRRDPPFRILRKAFSDAVTLDSKYILEVGGRRLHEVSVQKAEDIGSSRYDLIITDPPYGFNVAPRSLRELAQMYERVLPKLVAALRQGGQLVMALPDWSHNGQQFPFFAQREVVVRQVLQAAAAVGKGVVMKAAKGPAPRALFQLPYFWESTRALRREIVHFRFEALG